jgi:hypothetical protein
VRAGRKARALVMSNDSESSPADFEPRSSFSTFRFEIALKTC